MPADVDGGRLLGCSVARLLACSLACSLARATATGRRIVMVTGFLFGYSGLYLANDLTYIRFDQLFFTPTYTVMICISENFNARNIRNNTHQSHKHPK